MIAVLRPWIQRSVANRFVLFSVGTALGMVLLGAVAYPFVFHQSWRNFEDERSNSFVRIIDRLEQRLESIRQPLDQLSRNSLVVNAYVDSVGREVYLQPALRDFKLPFGIDSNVLLFDAGGKIFASRTPEDARLATRLQVFARNAVVRKRPQLGVLKDEAMPKLVLAFPVFYPPANEYEGALVARLDLGALLNFTQGAPSDSECMVVSAGGIEVYRWGCAGRGSAPSLTHPLLPQMFPDNDVTLVVGFGKSPSAVLTRLAAWLAIYLAVGATAVLVAWRISRRAGRGYARQLERLAQASRQLAQDPHAQVQVRWPHPDEFGAFVNSFQQMVLANQSFHANLERQLTKSGQESAEANRLMAVSLQGQGQLDMAFDRFCRVPFGPELMDNLYSLAADFERKRKYSKAHAVYAHMASHDAGYKDLQQRLARTSRLSEVVMLGGGTNPGRNLVVEGEELQKPMLGRYQVERELGKGAMGTVYLGRDPKIGRLVAIKTLSLSEEFDGDGLTEARSNFFREVETAGRLQHHNIVTIYDAGEDHDLAYIAMEFLRGQDLGAFCKASNLLPMGKAVSIAIRVAEALDYAHLHGVVHRDIKPANVMYDPERDSVKVSDFGIARITDSVSTRTGLVLGTPSYMSPEQISGQRVDGRADLYSLGVMLFQLLSGSLPFRAESMAELMFKIANAPAPDVRTLRPEIPERLAEIVACALSKLPEARYQLGAQVAQALRGVQDQLADAPPSGGRADPAQAAEVHDPAPMDQSPQSTY